jgi:hypothetical protein
VTCLVNEYCTAVSGLHTAELPAWRVRSDKVLGSNLDRKTGHPDFKFSDRLCGLVVRVPGYTTEMYCVCCEIRTEFIYDM